MRPHFFFVDFLGLFLVIFQVGGSLPAGVEKGPKKGSKIVSSPGGRVFRTFLGSFLGGRYGRELKMVDFWGVILGGENSWRGERKSRP